MVISTIPFRVDWGSIVAAKSPATALRSLVRALLGVLGGPLGVLGGPACSSAEGVGTSRGCLFISRPW